MARPPLALGHHGTIKVSRDDGQWVARCRFRDLDGVTRRLARWGTSKASAQAALQDELRKRTGQRTEVLKPNSRFREAADVWMGKIRERRADSTADAYASCLRNQVLPQLGELRLRGPPALDQPARGPRPYRRSECASAGADLIDRWRSCVEPVDRVKSRTLRKKIRIASTLTLNMRINAQGSSGRVK